MDVNISVTDPDPDGRRIHLVRRIWVQVRKSRYKVAPWNKKKEKKYKFSISGWSRSSRKDTNRGKSKFKSQSYSLFFTFVFVGQHVSDYQNLYVTLPFSPSEGVVFEILIPVYLSLHCGGENLRSRDEEIPQSNCNTYITQSADLCASSLLALKTNTYTSAYSCVLFILESTLLIIKHEYIIHMIIYEYWSTDVHKNCTYKDSKAPPPRWRTAYPLPTSKLMGFEYKGGRWKQSCESRTQTISSISRPRFS